MTLAPLAMPDTDPAGPLPELEPVDLETVWRLHWEDDVLVPTVHTPGKWRFDAPDGQFPVSYGNVSRDHAFVEVYGDTNAIDANQLGRNISRLEATVALRVVDIGDAAVLRAIGADLRLATDEDYILTQSWGVQIREWWPNADAIRYPGRKGGRQDNLCFWLDRCATKLCAHREDTVGGDLVDALRICEAFNLRPLFLHPPTGWS